MYMKYYYLYNICMYVNIYTIYTYVFIEKIAKWQTTKKQFRTINPKHLKQLCTKLVKLLFTPFRSKKINNLRKSTHKKWNSP